MAGNMSGGSSYFKGLTKRDYIKKTQEIILAEGREAASIRRIAKEMGCSSASLYRYFENQAELIYYAELNQLSGYIKRLNAAQKRWTNIWEYYVGIWDCYCREAFRIPEVYDLLFLKSENTKLNATITEYYEMFPEAVGETNQFFMEMLKQKDFMARDYEICKKCMAEGALAPEAAPQLNRLACVLYEGYFKEVVDKGIREEDVDARVAQYIEDLDWIVMHLAADLKGYRGYGK